MTQIASDCALKGLEDIPLSLRERGMVPEDNFAAHCIQLNTNPTLQMGERLVPELLPADSKMVWVRVLCGQNSMHPQLTNSLAS